MGALKVVDLVVLFVWWTLDNLVVFRRRAGTARRADRLSLMVIVLLSWVGIGLAVPLGFAGIGAPGAFTVPLQVAGLGILAAGIAIRSVAIFQLGAFHMPVVAIQEGHRLVEAGLYRRVRHPSYLGACVAYLGFGLGLGSLLSPAVLLGTLVPAYLYRIRVEEKALLESLGEEYAAYQRRTARLVPGIY